MVTITVTQAVRRTGGASDAAGTRTQPSPSANRVTIRMPALEVVDDSDDDSEDDYNNYDDAISLSDFQDGVDELAESFEALGMQYVSSYDLSCVFQPTSVGSSAAPPPSQPPPPITVPTTPPPPAYMVLPPAVTVLLPPQRSEATTHPPPPVYEGEGLPDALREYLHRTRTGKVYVVTRGYQCGVFDSWLTTSRYVTNYPGNAHKSYKADDVYKAWRHWCDHWGDHWGTGSTHGIVSPLSLIGCVLPGIDPRTVATAP